MHAVIRVTYRPRVEFLVIVELNYLNQPLRSYYVKIPDWREKMVFLEHDFYSPTLN